MIDATDTETTPERFASERRWRLAVGAEEAALGEIDRGLSAALTALYGDGDAEKFRRLDKRSVIRHFNPTMRSIANLFPSQASRQRILFVAINPAYSILALARLIPCTDYG
jgi:hypothetical protein